MVSLICCWKLSTQGHVMWDTAVPANLGYLASILWNQNNCIAEASPVTTEYELEAGTDLCVMIGFNREDSMGHLVTGGSVANIEAMWMARNLKYYPLGLQEALLKDGRLATGTGYQVKRFIFIFVVTKLKKWRNTFQGTSAAHVYGLNV